MQAILAVFRGEALLAEAPEQEFQPGTTVGAPGADDGAGSEHSTPADDEVPGEDETSAEGGDTPATTPQERPTSSTVVNGVTVFDVASNAEGIIPDPNITCG